jgi:hypothetical protein
VQAGVRFGGVGYAASERRWASSLKVSKSSLRAHCLLTFGFWLRRPGLGAAALGAVNCGGPILVLLIAEAVSNSNDAQRESAEAYPVPPVSLLSINGTLTK